MKRTPIPNIVLAITLAVILPLEQAHCAWMGLQNHAVPVAVAAPASAVAPVAAAEHACCHEASAARHAESSQPARSPQPAQTRPASIPAACVCAQLPAGTLPAITAPANPGSSVVLLAAPAALLSLAQISVTNETTPALDVGSPPLPVDPGAHGLRAPPVSA